MARVGEMEVLQAQMEELWVQLETLRIGEAHRGQSKDVSLVARIKECTGESKGRSVYEFLTQIDVILNEKFNPIWLQAKGFRPFWIYSLPSPTIVTKTCKGNGATQSFNIELSHTGILMDDIHCQFYSEAFILLPVSDGYTNVSLTSNQVLPPHLPELMSREERRQITHDELRTRRSFAALEIVVRQSSHVNQQPYVELRDLLDTVSTDGAMMSQVTWLYMLIAFSIILPFVILTLKYWRHPITLLI
ncbi:hypothetical protein B7P43_G11016 [Cryptotermes secundus]|uniref:Uncharacterized protein n=1 Tax=Cryptotermes secundus TaxID=105785 RepID=A0A2J7PHE3_9NEOP|nr:hypothetical protein B7P43_G11016 [Cryptotermes secundus]